MAGGSIEGRRRERLVQDCAAFGAEDRVQVLGRLARDYWDVPAAVMGEVLAHAPERRMPMRTVGVYYCRFGIGGVERVNRDLMLLWQSMGYRVVMICDDGPGDDDLPLPPGVECAYIPSCFTSHSEAYAPRARALSDVLARLGVDVLVYAQWLSLTLPWDAMVARMQGVSFVVHTHGAFSCLLGFGEADFTVLPPCYSHVDAVVCLSRADERFWRAYNVNSFCSVNPLSEHVARAGRAPLDMGATVLWVGRVQEVKRPLEALDAMRLVVREVPEARLVMVGPLIDYDREALEREARERGLEGHVEIVGPQPEEAMPQWYAQADAYLLTSHFEGYPLTLQEAMGSGVPCVLYEMPHLTLCEGARGVAMAPVGDVGGLANNLVELLQDPFYRRALGNVARTRVTELQGFDRVLLWREVFDVVATRGSAPAHVDEVGPRMWQAVYSVLDDAKRLACAQRDGRIAELEARVAELEGANARLRGDLDAVTGSVSFKTGRAITAPLRKARDAFGRRSD